MNFHPVSCLLAVCCVLWTARGADAAEIEPSEFDRAPRAFAYEVTIGDLGWKTSGPFTGWTKNFRRNPIPYRMTLAAVSVAYPTESRRPVLRHCEWVHSLVWSSIGGGPENHWGGFATGLRYHYALPARFQTSLYTSFQGGIGGIDSSGQRYAQAKDLTFAYLAALGVRVRISENLAVHAQVLGQHISNGWQTRPSEGIDCSGWSLSVSYRPGLRAAGR